jgi:hypothetical protein
VFTVNPLPPHSAPPPPWRKHAHAHNQLHKPTQMMHVLLGAICCLFGLLWMRALERARTNVCERAALSRGVRSVLAGVDTHTRGRVVASVVALQAAVRRRQATPRPPRSPPIYGYRGGLGGGGRLVWCGVAASRRMEGWHACGFDVCADKLPDVCSSSCVCGPCAACVRAVHGGRRCVFL